MADGSYDLYGAPHIGILRIFMNWNGSLTISIHQTLMRLELIVIYGCVITLIKNCTGTGKNDGSLPSWSEISLECLAGAVLHINFVRMSNKKTKLWK